MSNNPKKIGEGSYGCAYRPAIPCADAANTDIDQKISKVLNVVDANNEYAEYTQIAKADPNNEYYLGKPQKCTMSEANYDAFVKKSGCRIIRPNTTAKDYRLLQYGDGGSDLDDFARVHLTKFLSTWPERQSDYFWLNAHKLFLGLKNFAENDILHDDLKPQNIVFKFDLAKDTMDFNFIDFGLVKNLITLKIDVYRGAVTRSFHWSRPLEQGIIHSAGYIKTLYSSLNDDVIVKYYTETLSDIILYDVFNQYGIRPDSFRLLHEYTSDSLNPNTNVIIEERIRSCMQGITMFRSQIDKFFDKTFDTTDSYSLGFTLNHVANKMHKKGAIPDNEYTRLHQFFEKLFDFNLFTRWDDIDMMISEYESVLELNGVLRRLGKQFVNHKVENKVYNIKVKLVPSLSQKQAIEVGALSPNPAPPNLKPCPPGKVRNPITRRCNKVKSQSKTKRINPCPPGKERNPKTGRCIKVGSPKNIVPKSCPPGKELNPDTGRCVNLCPSGKIRRNGRCVYP